MGVRILGPDEPGSALVDSVTGMVFGPVFTDSEAAGLFLAWYQGKYGDPRVEWFKSFKGQQTFLARYRDWCWATQDPKGEFRLDIAIQMMRDVT